MHFFSLSPLCLLSFSLLLHTVFGVDPLFHFCSNSGKYTTDSPFGNNMNMLTSYLSSKAPPVGFELKSIGQDEDVVHGLALCRGDVQSADCKSCITEASTKIVELCPNDKGAIVWYENCLLRYSNIKYFGKIDYVNRFYMYNLQNVSEGKSFNQKSKELIGHLTTKAYISPLLFATGELKLGDSGTLHGLVQCTKDLSGIQCKKCLDDAASKLDSCCDGKTGGRVVGGSCNLRYELYPFVNSLQVGTLHT